MTTEKLCANCGHPKGKHFNPDIHHLMPCAVRDCDCLSFRPAPEKAKECCERCFNGFRDCEDCPCHAPEPAEKAEEVKKYDVWRNPDGSIAHVDNEGAIVHGRNKIYTHDVKTIAPAPRAGWSIEKWLNEKAERFSVLTDLQTLIKSLLSQTEKEAEARGYERGKVDGVAEHDAKYHPINSKFQMENCHGAVQEALASYREKVESAIKKIELVYPQESSELMRDTILQKFKEIE